MHTLLSRFCEEFVHIVRPLRAPLDRAADCFSRAPDGERDPAAAAQLVDLRHQIGLLADKVEEQQAYVLIFGPLKSGKSTLMNAIAGSYVSEVSSLPAYPCMVFVSHAEQREFVLTRYDGRTDTFAGPEEMQRHVDEAHRELAARIRQAEASGADFDPRSDYTKAISKIQVKVPTEALGRSSAVLVDTPGLYSRMKFGYDRMTRDFRNAAACAVFVVRSDNLFLEQVFAEFTDLLELFSRIFLVVNVDSRKVDLGPSKLVPSLEQRDPQRIVEAFELLAMSEPLKRAADEGRLRIYPVDLLEAGRRRLYGVEDGERPESGFEPLFEDLTSYLDSTDHLVAFLGDSMRRASMLLGEIDELCDSDRLERLRARMERLTAEAERQREVRRCLVELEKFDWARRLGTLREELESSCRLIAADIGDRTARETDQSVRDWFRSADSLNTLAKEQLTPAFVRYQERMIEALSRELSERLVRGGVGVEVPPGIAAALERVGLDLPAIGRYAHGLTDRQALVRVPPTPLRSEHFTVTGSAWDGVMLRSQPALRQRLLGPAECPDHRLSAEQKRTRLADQGRQAALSRLEEYRDRFFADTVDRLVTDFANGYCDLVRRGAEARFARLRADLEKQASNIEAERARCQLQLEPLQRLAQCIKQALADVAGLSQRYGDMDRDLLARPHEAETPVQLPAAPPAVAKSSAAK